jgi:2-polyprenyl-3-methyl-5-hydroxy-6-metoxy-1,4-benzoquinol methylase
VFSDPRPDEASEQDYYRERYRQEYKGFFVPRPVQAYRGALGAWDRLARLRSILPKDGPILDIGCGAGEFPFVLKSQGYNASGLEPDQACAEFARTRLDLRIESRPLEDPVPGGGPFQVITMFHVLEHMVDPRSALRLLASWLGEDGRLVVEVPNVESQCTAPHHRFHRAHLYSFNIVSLAATGEAAGLTCTDRMSTPDGGTITAVFARGVSSEATGQLPANADRVRRSLEGYTNLRHYLGGTLIRQQWSKLRRNARVWWATRRLTDPVEAVRLATEREARPA